MTPDSSTENYEIRALHCDADRTSEDQCPPQLGIFSRSNGLSAGSLLFPPARPLLRYGPLDDGPSPKKRGSDGEGDVLLPSLRERYRDSLLPNSSDLATPFPTGTSEAATGLARSLADGGRPFYIVSAYAAADAATRRAIVDMYRPLASEASSKGRTADVVAACALVAECAVRCLEGGGVSVSDAETAILVSLFNAFEGGRLYGSPACRLNHSCDANCIYDEALFSDADDGGDKTTPALSVRVSATCVPTGKELTVSYLGLFHYADIATRRTMLYKDKAFVCGCERCCLGDGKLAQDFAGAVPCPKCHVRKPDGTLYEDVAFDDGEGDVCYAVPSDVAEKNGTFFVRALKCTSCGAVTDDRTARGKLVMKILRGVSEKVVDRLSSSPSKTAELDDDAEEEFDQDLFELSLSTLGPMHWTTNLISLSLLDRSLVRFHTGMLTGRLPEEEDLAEAIDSLQCLWKYADGLRLTGRNAGAALLYRQTLGVCRVLVATRNPKSVKYAQEWAERVAEYVRTFEGEHWAKVVGGIERAESESSTAQEVEDGQDEEMESLDLVEGKQKKKRCIKL